MNSPEIRDPIQVASVLWPDVQFYREQKEIIYSVENNDETIVPAGNQLGKDFVAGFIIVSYFLRHHPCKIITTSAVEKHLDNLWGEIDRFIRTSKYPLTVEKGGPLIAGEGRIRKVVNGEIHKDSYVLRSVSTSANRGEGLQGHHSKYTLFVADEASGIPEIAYQMVQGWAKRILIIGNPITCTNFFYRNVKAGDLKAPTNGHMYRKIIKIQAADSPNVRYGLRQEKFGIKPTNEEILPGVLSYHEYCKRRETWDAIRQCWGLDAEFYEGAEVLMFPPEWLGISERAAVTYDHPASMLRTMGVDPAEGGDHSCWSIVDELGLIHQLSLKTPDTTVVPARTIALMQQYSVRPENVFFDRGGGGKEHADQLRKQGYNVNTVAFGESAMSDERFIRRMKSKGERIEDSEVQYTYLNRRAQMYGELRLRLDPTNEKVFSIGKEYVELRRQLAPIPLGYDPEGRLKLPPKNKRSATSTEITLTEMLGCSPDEADSLVLAVFGLSHRPKKMTIGVAF